MSSSTQPSPTPSETEKTQSQTKRATAVLLGLAALPVLMALVVRDDGYGYFSDTFYYLACSDHLAWGYVDHPPLSIALLALVRATLGDSILALHLLPALAVAGSVFLTGLMARRLGAGTFGQALAALAAVVTPIYMIQAGTYSMNPFDLLFWCLGVYVILGILKSGDPKGWLLFGLIAGFGLQNKLSMGFLLVGLVVALLLTPSRKYIASKVDGKLRPGWHLWGGVGLAVLIFLPHLVWQAQNGWPTPGFARTINELYGASPLNFMLGQVMGMNVFNFPIWLAGLYFFLFSQRGKAYRVMGIIFVSVFILLIVQHTRAYYLSVAYPMLFAGGAVLVESFFERKKWRARILKPLTVTALVAGIASTVPVLLPVLPPEEVLKVVEDMPPEMRGSLGVPEDHVELPQVLASRMCWEGFVAEVARVYETLPEEDQKACVIFAGSYHSAGAIDFLDKEYGLPPARSTHNNYWLWGPGDSSWDVVIIAGATVTKESLEELFGEVVEAGRTSCKFASGLGRNNPVYICRKMKRPIAELWAEDKHFN